MKKVLDTMLPDRLRCERQVTRAIPPQRITHFKESEYEKHINTLLIKSYRSLIGWPWGGFSFNIFFMTRPFEAFIDRCSQGSTTFPNECPPMALSDISHETQSFALTPSFLIRHCANRSSTDDINHDGYRRRVWETLRSIHHY